MNKKRLADVVATYGEGWEETADLIHPLIAAALAEVPQFEDAFCDPRTPEQRADDADWKDEQDTIADIMAGL